jgi:probable rRNA maturation factor
LTRLGAKATRALVTVGLTIERGPYAGVERREVRRRIAAMIDLLQLRKMDVSFVLTDDIAIHRLNKIYRGKDAPTDVLAFAMREGEHGDVAGSVLGDVIVSVEAAKKQAGARGIAVLDEVTMLLAHGLLHLLGWDHDTAAKDRRMRAETDRLCAAARAGQPRASKGRARSPLTRNRTKAKPRPGGRKD